MKRTSKQQELEKKLILEEYNPITLEDRAENEQLLLDTETVNCKNEYAADLVRNSYSKLKNGHAIVRTQFSLFILFGVIIFGLGIPAFFITMYITQKWWNINGTLFCVLFFSLGFMGAAFGLYWVFLRTSKKLFDVYYFQQGKKRIIIYQNNKHTIYYRNRKEFVCIENKTKKSINDYGRDNFMNLKLGFNFLVGNLQLKKLKKGGYFVWTPVRYSTATKLRNFTGYASLKIDNELKSQKNFYRWRQIYFIYL